MMSSEEETDCFAAKQDRSLLKKNRRTRQRVDAGEPRNSYASIPNFSSRPPAPPYLLSSPPLSNNASSGSTSHNVPGVSSSSPSANNGWLLASPPHSLPPPDHERASPMIEIGANNNSSSGSFNYSGTLATKGGAPSGELRHLLPLMSYRHQRSPLRALQRSPHHHHHQHQGGSVATSSTTRSSHHHFRRRSHSLDNNNGAAGGHDSDSDGGVHRRDHSASVVVDIECSVLNGNNNNLSDFRDVDMAPQQHGLHHPSQRTRSAAGRGGSPSTSSATSSSNEGDAAATNTTSSSSQLLREILQGGSGAAKIAAASSPNDSTTNGSSYLSASTADTPSAKTTNGGSLISHLLTKNKNQSPISGRTRHNTNKNKRNNRKSSVATLAPPENKEEDEVVDSEGETPTAHANEVAVGTAVHDSQPSSDDEVDQVGEEEETEEMEAEGEEENETMVGVEPEDAADIAAVDDIAATRQRQSRVKMNGERAPPSPSPPPAFGGEDFTTGAKRSRLVIDEKKVSIASVDDDDDDDVIPVTHESTTTNAACSSSSTLHAPITSDSTQHAPPPPPQQQQQPPPPQSQSTPTDAELKRARVENIISTMRSSPSRPAPGDGPTVNGCKKRKRYMPQQHEARITATNNNNAQMQQNQSAGNSDGGDRLSPPTLFDDDDDAAEEEEFLALAPAGKMRRTHQQVVLRHQLNLMQAQIAAIQQKLDTYGQPESSDSGGEEVVASGYNSDDGQHSNNGFAEEEEGRVTPPPRPVSRTEREDSPVDDMASSPVPPALYHRYSFSTPSAIEQRIAAVQHHQQQQQQQPPPLMGKSPRTPDLEPAHFIDEARRLVFEQERVTKEADNRKTAPPSLSVAAMTSSSPAEPKVAATAAAAAAAVAAASGPVPRPSFAVVPPDWESLADTLKTGMSNLIDDWVRRFSTTRPSSAGPLLAALVKSDKKNESCRPVTGASIQTSVAPGNPATPCSSSSVAATSGSLLTTSVSTGNGGGFHHHHQSLGSALMSSAAAATSHLQDRRSPRTKVIDRGRMGAGALGAMPPGVSLMGPGGVSAVAAAFLNSASAHHFSELHLKAEPNSMSGLFSPQHHKPGSMPLYMQHHAGPPPPPHHQLPPSLANFYSHRLSQGGRESPEQSEALPLVVTPKKKRHKVTDTRITPRTVSRILGHQEALMESASGGKYVMGGGGVSPAEVSYAHHQQQQQQQQHHPHHHPHQQPPMVPVSLPTSVAIPNPGLHQSDVFSPYPYFHPSHQPRASPGSDGMDDAASMFHPLHPHHQALQSNLLLGQSSPDPSHLGGGGGRDGNARSNLKTENGGDSSDCNSGDLMYSNDGTLPTSSTLTPMHLRKAKLMFFFVRYPSSAILKTYFPDIQFNKNNTAQLVKWFSNFREFYYIQMEKYARQAISEGCKNAEDITVTVDSELYRVINLHYNRNNHIEVPTNFRFVVEQTLREFFKAVSAGKDSEQSWKKSIYKVIARLDDNLPDYFKSPNFLEQLE